MRSLYELGMSSGGRSDVESSDIQRLRVDVARACRILAVRGLVSGVLGHVSVRAGEDRALVRCRGPHERGLLFTTSADIRLLALGGDTDPGDGYAVPNELPLHLETLRARPEAMAVVHAHPPAVVTADLAGVALRPIVGGFNIPALRLAEQGIPVYPRSVLIRRSELAEEMLSTMGTSPVCVLRGHGLTSIGETLSQAVARALHVDELARICLDVARAGGRPVDVPPQDSADLPDLGSTFNDDLLWAHQVADLQHRGLDILAE
jgi:ribulose-5-phosphate 4-epimerase/fuculose-1-phosphate aldolase